MAAIAYIADHKMLEFHRLNSSKVMYFWRLSIKNSFSDFKEGDIIFFLDKKIKRNKEKGIVGFARLDRIYVNAPKTLWNKYKKGNGYNSFNEFREAICRVSKNHELPKQITSFCLKDVIFLGGPIYLSEFNINISNNLESYVYIKPETMVLDMLDRAKDIIDVWSYSEDMDKILEDEKIAYSLRLINNEYGDYPLREDKYKRAHNLMKKLIERNPLCNFIGNSKLDLYYIDNKNVLIVLYASKKVDIRYVIGQAELYRNNIYRYYKDSYKLYFKTSNGDKKLEAILNKQFL